MNTIGATDGSIIAAIIVTQIPRNQPSPPRLVPGPASIPRIRCTTTIHVTSPAATSSTTTVMGAMRMDGGRAVLSVPIDRRNDSRVQDN